MAEVLQYVLGYKCPTCRSEGIGFEIPNSGGRHGVAWTFRKSVQAETRIACFSCDADVPREHWIFEPLDVR